MRQGRFTSCIAGLFTIAIGMAVSASPPQYDDSSNATPSLSKLLPPSVAQNVDLNAWGWLSYAPAIPHNRENYWDLDLALGANVRLGDRIAATADFHFIDDNGSPRGELQQAFVTGELFKGAGTLLTVGKFNSPFGVEPRNAWDRLNGTTSLLFGAEPQDLLGLMLTQPLGDTHITARPFVVTDFQGRSNLQGPPAAGIMLEYQPRHEISFALTNWIGPGFTREEYDKKPNGEYASSSEEEIYSSSILENWNGPHLQADRGGTLYFVDAKANWLATPDLTFAAEGLLALDGPSPGSFGWGGLLLLANYDITDRFRLFARWSFLDDNQGIVTGIEQHRNEISGGAAYQFIPGWELRGEYRHDFSDQAGDLDALSAHLTFAY